MMMFSPPKDFRKFVSNPKMCNEGVMMSLYPKLLLLVVVLLLAPSVAAQTYRGSIRGTITDPNKAVIPAASLRLTNKETNELRTTVTNVAGEYSISALPPGPYTLEVTAGGFRNLSQDIVLSINQELRVDAALEVEIGRAHV